MNELLYSLLNSTGNAIFALKAPQNQEKPYSVYSPVSDVFETCSDGSIGDLEVLYQVDTFGIDYQSCKTITAEFVSALQQSTDFECVIYNSRDTIEDTGRTFRTMLEFKLWK